MVVKKRERTIGFGKRGGGGGERERERERERDWFRPETEMGGDGFTSGSLKVACFNFMLASD